MSLQAVWTEEHRLHDPKGEVWIGVPIEGDEVPPRGDVFREVIESLNVTMIGPRDHGIDPIVAVHDRNMVSYLETAYGEWAEAGYPEDPGQDRVVAYVFPHSDAIRHLPRRWPTSRAARAGVYCMDTTTVISPGTYRAARAAVDASLTAADLVLDGAQAAYAAVRPPGHHAGSTFFGGSCYLNNAAITAQYLVGKHAGKVGIIDIDAHHGNGTQEIFYERGDVIYLSTHIDPGAGWFPHFLGFADERGIGEGAGANRNLPLSPNDGDDAFIAALEQLIEEASAWGIDLLVVSLGLDMATADQNSPLNVTSEGFNQAGLLLASMTSPAVLIQEGGYDLRSLRSDLAAILAPLSSAET